MEKLIFETGHFRALPGPELGCGKHSLKLTLAFLWCGSTWKVGETQVPFGYFSHENGNCPHTEQNECLLFFFSPAQNLEKLWKRVELVLCGQFGLYVSQENWWY